MIAVNPSPKSTVVSHVKSYEIGPENLSGTFWWRLQGSWSIPWRCKRYIATWRLGSLDALDLNMGDIHRAFFNDK